MNNKEHRISVRAALGIGGAVLLAFFAINTAESAEVPIGQLSVLGDATVGQSENAVGVSYNVMVYFAGDPVTLEDNTNAVLRLADGVGSVSVGGNGAFTVSGDTNQIRARVRANAIEFSFAKDKNFQLNTDCFTITNTNDRDPATGNIGPNGHLAVSAGQVQVENQSGLIETVAAGDSASCDRIAGATFVAATDVGVGPDLMVNAAVATAGGLLTMGALRGGSTSDGAGFGTDSANGSALAVDGDGRIRAMGSASDEESNAQVMVTPAKSSGNRSTAAARLVSVAAAVATGAGGGGKRGSNGRGNGNGRVSVIPPEPVGAAASPTSKP